jgi:hypothetical protein
MLPVQDACLVGQGTMPVLANRYQLIEPIYDDGIVVAYRAADQVLNRTVTVETLSPQAPAEHVERLTEKAHRAALTRIAYVAKLYDQNVDAGRPFLVWEGQVGPTLAEMAPLPDRQAVEVVYVAAMALQTALTHHQLPPAINPQTLCIDPMGRVQIIDLGLHQSSLNDQQAVKTLGDLLHVALGQGNSVPMSLQALVSRAQTGNYATIDEFVADLRQTRQHLDAPTSMVPHNQRLIEEVSPAPARARSPLSTATPARSNHHPWRWLALAAVTGSLILLFSTLVRGDQFNIDRVVNLAPMLEPTLATTPAVTQETAPTVADLASTESWSGALYIVNTNAGQPVRIRAGPGLAFEPIAAVPFGNTVEVMSEPQPADGYTWVRVRAAGIEGWCISEALLKY